MVVAENRESLDGLGKGGDKCRTVMDLEEEVGDGGWDMDSEEGWGLDLEWALPPGPMSAWGEADCPGMSIS